MEFLFGLTEPGVIWRDDPDEYTEENHIGWQRRIAESDSVRDADLVLSDNLAGVLACRSDAVLLGSFLWSDVLARAYPQVPSVQAFAEQERALLARHRPPMICVQPAAHPALAGLVQMVPVPWMCRAPVPVATPRKNTSASEVTVGLQCGATRTMDDDCVHLAQGLVAHTQWNVALPDRLLRRQLPGLCSRARPFEFPNDYGACDIIVGRAGMGTITDCIANSVPFVAVTDGRNDEIIHLARRVAKLGLGLNAGAHPAVGSVIQLCSQLMEPETQRRVAGCMAEQKRDGLRQAASWILERLRQRRQG
jgi:hypothetical protein